MILKQPKRESKKKKFFSSLLGCLRSASAATTVDKTKQKDFATFFLQHVYRQRSLKSILKMPKKKTDNKLIKLKLKSIITIIIK